MIVDPYNEEICLCGERGCFEVLISTDRLMYDPDLVILQGAYARAGDYFLLQLRKRVNTVSLLNVEKEIRIEYS
jgi:predicted NBD/HSP70 family sugar kinase